MRHRKMVGLLVMSLSLTSCSLFKTSCTCNTVTGGTEADSLSVIYSDSIDAILLKASKVRVYDMADFVENNDSTVKSDSLFNYRIKNEKGFLKDKEHNILSFILSDKYWYISKYAPIRQPFHPNFALEFIFKKEKAFVFVSFGTEEIAISDSTGHFRFFQMRDKRLIARWACIVFPKEEYYKEFIKQVM